MRSAQEAALANAAVVAAPASSLKAVRSRAGHEPIRSPPSPRQCPRPGPETLARAPVHMLRNQAWSPVLPARHSHRPDTEQQGCHLPSGQRQSHRGSPRGYGPCCCARRPPRCRSGPVLDSSPHGRPARPTEPRTPLLPQPRSGVIQTPPPPGSATPADTDPPSGPAS